MKRLNTRGKILLLVLIALILGGVGYAIKDLPAFQEVVKGKVDFGSTGSDNKASSSSNTTGTDPTGAKEDQDVIRLSLDEWIGWKSILDANGGLKTAKGSIYDKMGLKVEISIINDATASSKALITNNLDAAGYTVNRYAFLYPQFQEAKVQTKMAYITNYSYGGDGIIANKNIKSIEGLVGKKIGVPRFSEAQTLVEWLLSNSSLTDKQVTDIRKNVVYFDTPDDAAKAFFAGQVDAAATWQPYLSQASSTAGSKILFDTTAAPNLILDGIVFREDYMKAHEEQVTKFIEGALNAYDLYTTEFEPIQNSMPLFSQESAESIKGMSGDARLADFQENEKLYKGTAQQLFKDMSNIWLTLGESGMPDEALNAFDNSAFTPLKDKFLIAKSEPIIVTQAQKEAVAKQSNDTALIKKTMSVKFESNSSGIKQESFKELNEFAEVAKIMNGVVIQIEGNTDDVGAAETNQKLSLQRAKAVMEYLKYQGVDPTRMIAIGNGESKPVADNKTEAGKAANRRTNAFFKVVN